MAECRRAGCAMIACLPSPACASGNHCYVLTEDGFVVVRDAKNPEAKPAVFTGGEWQDILGEEVSSQ